jgi:uncharacterized protein
MQYEWDEAKRLQNLKDHGIDFVDAGKVFAGPTFTFEDNRYRYEEQRFVTLGLLDGVPVSIVHTETEDVIRPISFRRATAHETAILFEKIADQLPPASVHEGRGHPAHARAPRSKRKAHHARRSPKRPKGRST